MESEFTIQDLIALHVTFEVKGAGAEIISAISSDEFFGYADEESV